MQGPEQRLNATTKQRTKEKKQKQKQKDAKTKSSNNSNRRKNKRVSQKQASRHAQQHICKIKLNLDGRHGSLQQARMRFEMPKGNASKDEGGYKAAAHAAARRWLPHPNILQPASCHAVDGALSKTVEHDRVNELRQPRARSDEVHRDVSRIAAANAARVGCSHALARV